MEPQENNPDASQPSSAPGYALEDTVIEKGGVLRCCLGSVALEFTGKQVRIGDTSVCPYCKIKFVLVEPSRAGMTCYHNLTKPIWKPEWQLLTAPEVIDVDLDRPDNVEAHQQPPITKGKQ